MTLSQSVKSDSFRQLKSEGKLSSQQNLVYYMLSTHQSPLTAWEIQTALELRGEPMLITSIRRCLTDLHDKGKIRAVDFITEKYKHKNTRWTVA